MRRLMLFLFACAWAALNPWLAESHPADPVEAGLEADLAWPSHWDGKALAPLPLTGVERKFAGDFPGALARFSDGSRELLFRRVARPTRKLHPSADCLQAAGYRIKPLPAESGPGGKTWSRLRADRKGVSLAVSEIILDADGKSWSDVSSWYWSAVLGKSRGPWLAVTASRRISPSERAR